MCSLVLMFVLASVSISVSISVFTSALPNPCQHGRGVSSYHALGNESAVDTSSGVLFCLVAVLDSPRIDSLLRHRESPCSPRSVPASLLLGNVGLFHVPSQIIYIAICRHKKVLFLVFLLLSRRHPCCGTPLHGR